MIVTSARNECFIIELAAVGRRISRGSLVCLSSLDLAQSIAHGHAVPARSPNEQLRSNTHKRSPNNISTINIVCGNIYMYSTSAYIRTCTVHVQTHTCTLGREISTLDAEEFDPRHSRPVLSEDTYTCTCAQLSSSDPGTVCASSHYRSRQYPDG